MGAGESELRHELNRQEWDDYSRKVTEEMREYAWPFVASILRVHSLEEASLLGSGTYLQLLDNSYLLTNQHVAAERRTHSLAHLLADEEFALGISGVFQALSDPVDAAVCRIEQGVWNSGKTMKRAVPIACLAQKHEPVERELLFMMGFSGERFYFSNLVESACPTATPYCTQESVVPEELKSDFHFGLRYSTERAVSLDASGRGLPDPHGFSGSAVWNTRAVEYLLSGRRWTPENAEVTGMVRRWSDRHACLLATRIEFVRSFLLQALRQEAAYFQWESRGRPVGDDLADWTWAVGEIPDLR